MTTKRNLMTMLNHDKRMKKFCTKIKRYKMTKVIDAKLSTPLSCIVQRFNAQPLIYTMVTCHDTCSCLVRFCIPYLILISFLTLTISFMSFHCVELTCHLISKLCTYHLILSMFAMKIEYNEY